MRFSEFLELIPDATVAVGRDGEIVLANGAALDVFGYPRDQLEGLSVDALVPERFRAGHAGHRAHYVSDPQTRPMGAGLELYGLRADGSEFPAEISLSSATTAEGVLAIAAIRDITDRVGADAERARLEAELKLTQSQRLESIGQLAGGIAHDFNNLLAVIINYAEFASSAADSQEVLDDVAEIQAAAKRAAALTRQLLIFSRREGVKLEPMQLNESLENLEKLLRRVLGEHIQLTSKFAEDLWPVVADAGQIEQIALNLAVNARDAMPDGGVLEMETRNVELDAEYTEGHEGPPKAGRYVRLTVSDSGIGMDRMTLQRAFEPFFTTKPKPKGTGLGLATVYGIVQNHGGSAFIYSEPGKGTSVKIHLPASDLDPESIRTSSDAVIPVVGGQGETVIVVEDEKAVRAMVVRALKSNGYKVVDFSRGLDAVEFLKADPGEIALLLSDVIMPEMQGSELAREAGRLRPDLPVLFMSGYSELMLERVDPTQAGVNLIEKPFSVNDLLREVRRVLKAGAG